MIKNFLILAILVCTLSCRKETKASEFTDDYVLIEFAAKLEEDYNRIYPEPLDNRTKESTR